MLKSPKNIIVGLSALNAENEKKGRKKGNFFVSMQKITTFACLFGEMP
jgi:hypothetical protein